MFYQSFRVPMFRPPFAIMVHMLLVCSYHLFFAIACLQSEHSQSDHHPLIEIQFVGFRTIVVGTIWGTRSTGPSLPMVHIGTTMAFEKDIDLAKCPRFYRLHGVQPLHCVGSGLA